MLGVGVVLQCFHGSSPQRSAAQFLGAPAGGAGVRRSRGGGVCVCAAAVRAAVSAQDCGAREALAAGVAGVGPLTRVRAHVTLKITGARETLPAGLAAVGFVSAVPELVFEQLPLHVEGFSALLAGELLLRAVRLLVLLQVAEVAEASSADVTQVRPRSRVDDDVPLDVSGRCEALPTELTDVRLLS